MRNNTTSIVINVSDKIYIRDPEMTELGRKIITHSIHLIDELGFEEFTFKKLAKRVDSTEASVYRYFENKHNLLVYIASWYWSWLEYQIDYETHNMTDKKEKLRLALHTLIGAMLKENQMPYMNEGALHRIIVREVPKAYHTKHVDEENKDGFYRSYKALCKKLGSIMHEYAPKYEYAHALSSTVLEAIHHQVYFAQHLPSLTEIKVVNKDYDQVLKYIEHLVFSIVRPD
jgi:AcrR family transcriptional regulator